MAHLKHRGESSGKAFGDLFIKEAPRVNAEDERDGSKVKADTEDRAIKGFPAEFDDMDRTLEKLAKPLEKTGG